MPTAPTAAPVTPAVHDVPLLAVHDLRVALPGPQGAPLAALRGVSFELQRGQVLGLIGESGCGKSLTALALMGLLPDDSVVTGSIRLAGRELLGLAESQWCGLRGKRLGMIFQEPMTALNPLQRIGDQVAEPLRLPRGDQRGLSRTQAREAALHLLQRVQLPQAAQRLDAWPHQLSGGQRQRVMIATALACGPDVLVADEPTTALDVSLQREVLQLMAGLVREDGMALLLISHDLALVAQQAQRLLVMYAGQVVENGPVGTVLRHGAHPYTRALLAARPLLGLARGTRLATIPGRVPALADMPAGCGFAPRCPRADAACRADLPALATVGPDHATRCIHPHPETRPA